ncbi:MAG: hypothetical protein VX733_15100 [Candidatus Latescibacterota bacterium]|nr:hypothetical protein [Candidatus Latescibacterota bacterium]
MPFFLQPPNSSDRSELTESQVRRMLQADVPEQQRDEVWRKLLRGEKVVLRAGPLVWESASSTSG